MSFIELPGNTEQQERIMKNADIVHQNILRQSNEVLGTDYIPELDWRKVDIQPIVSLLLMLQIKHLERGFKELCRRLDA